MLTLEEKSAIAAKKYVGQKKNMLTIVSPAGQLRGFFAYVCLCECGNRKIYPGAEVMNGHVKSCGCRNRALRKFLKQKRLNRLRGRSPQERPLTIFELMGNTFGKTGRF
jgi:hypothetical protein